MNHTAEALRYGTCSQGISQYYLHTHTFIRNRNEPYLPLPSQPQLVLIYWPLRDGRLSRPWCEVAQAEIRTRNLPIANPALYHTATRAPFSSWIRWGQHRAPRGRIRVSLRLFNGNNFATWAALAELCVLPSVILVFVLSYRRVISNCRLSDRNGISPTNIPLQQSPQILRWTFQPDVELFYGLITRNRR